MASSDLIPFNERNRDPRAACVLLLDTSGSMSTDNRIGLLSRGFATFVEELNDDPLSRKRVEVAVVTFDSHATLAVPFREARDLTAQTFTASGSTNLAEGIVLALDQLEARKAEYKAANVKYFRPWLFVLSDGAANGGINQSVAIDRLISTQNIGGVTVFSVGVGNQADLDFLGTLSIDRPAIQLNGLSFGEMFQWLSNSLASVSASQAAGASDESISTLSDTTQVQLSPVGWGHA